jgi:hypothetical protein
MSFRPLVFALAIGALMAPGPVSGKDTGPSVQNSTLRRYTAEETAALGAAADRRALAQQRKWDRRLQQISGSICDSCSPP